jgi:hypothetical protein
MVKRLLTVPAIGTIATAAWLCAGCAPKTPEAAVRVAPEIALKQVQLRLYRGARLSTSGTAAEVAFERQTGAIVATAASARFSRSTGRDAVARADRVEGDLSSRRFVARGHVVFADGDGRTAETEEARYEPTPRGDGRLFGGVPVRVRSAGLDLSGQRFEADPGTGRVVLSGGVLGTGGPD